MAKVEGRFLRHVEFANYDEREWSDWMPISDVDKGAAALELLLTPAGEGATIERVSYHSDGTEDTRIQWRLRQDVQFETGGSLLGGRKVWFLYTEG